MCSRCRYLVIVGVEVTNARAGFTLHGSGDPILFLFFLFCFSSGVPQDHFIQRESARLKGAHEFI